MGWLLNVTRLSKPRLQVLYDPFGRTDMPEEELDHLEGYRGSRPVRVGNAADEQFQLDFYGEVLLAASDFVGHGGRLERSEAKLLAKLGRTICELWRQPDNGIWEFRGERRHYTYSKLMCWVGLDRLLGLAREGHVAVDEEPLRRERDAVRDEIETKGFDPELDSYLAVLGGRDIDASLLLMSVHGYHPPHHPRIRGTVERIRRVLGRQGLLCRYGDAEQGASPGEAAFGICNFWLVDHLCRLGQVHEATTCFEELLSLANDVGLFAEEIAPDSREARGNFPQAFTHVGLINAALAIARAGREAAA
jgi:GH15 family glucan-1,4-alpha-glucosidase